MGFDIQRFPNGIDEELIWESIADVFFFVKDIRFDKYRLRLPLGSICGGVLQDPLQIPTCEHAFCQGCIHEWLLHASICPIDRTSIQIDHLKAVPRILRTLLNRLTISCDNEGCPAVVKLDNLASHLLECEFNPKKIMICGNGCGMTLSKEDLVNHQCIPALRQELDQVKMDLEKSKIEMDFYKNEVRTLQEFIRAIRLNHPTVSCVCEPTENDEILRWSGTLQLARVTRWGGMISTPDIVLQGVIKRALLDSGCPETLTNDLMANAHERHWPEGLSTLETRQTNRRHYESYVCRRIVGKQAVVVLSCDNRHMDQIMIMEPGIIMIFAHGVE